MNTLRKLQTWNDPINKRLYHRKDELNTLIVLAKSRNESCGKCLHEEKAALERKKEEAIIGIEKEQNIKERFVKEISVLKEMIQYTDKQATDVIVTLKMQEEVRNNIEA